MWITHTYLKKVHGELHSWDNGIDQCQQHGAPLPQHSWNNIFKMLMRKHARFIFQAKK